MKASQALEIFLSLNATGFKAGVKAAGKSVGDIGGAVKRSMKVSKTAFRVGRKSVDAYKGRLKELNSTAGGVTSTMAKLAAIVGGGMIFGKGAQMAVGFNSTVEQSQIGIAALVRTFNQVPEGADKYAQSMEVAGDIQRSLQIEGLKTVATYEQLLVALQEGIGPAFKRGFNPQQVVDFTSQMTQAAAAISLPMDQLGQEIRSILAGTIDKNSRIARTLDIDSPTIEKMAAAGKLVEYLSDKLKEFKVAGADAARTWTGALSNLMDAIQMALGTSFKKSFEAAKQLFLDLRDAIVTIDEVAGTFTFNEKISAALDGANQAISGFLDGISNADIQNYLEILGDTVAAVVAVVGTFLSVMKNLFDLMGPALPIIAGATTGMILLGGAFEVVIGMPLMLAKHIMALNATLTVLTGQSFAGWAGQAVSSFIQIREGLTMAKIAGMGLKGLLGSFGGILLAWQVGTAIGEWLTNFDCVNKAALGVIYTLDRGVLSVKRWWASLTGGDTAAIDRQIKIAQQTYTEMIDEINHGGDKGVSAHEKIAAAAAASAKKQLAVTKAGLKKQGEAYAAFANQVSKMMPGEEGYKGSEAYQSWKDIEGAGLTLDAPQDGMTKDELAAFYKSKEQAAAPSSDRGEKTKTKEKEISLENHLTKLTQTRNSAETVAARDRVESKEQELSLSQQMDAERKKSDQDRDQWLNNRTGDDKATTTTDTAPTDKTPISNGTIDPAWQLNKQLEDLANPQQDPVITTTDPVIVQAPTVDATPALTDVFNEYTDRTQKALAKSPWTVAKASQAADKSSDTPATATLASPISNALTAPLDNMKQQAKDAVAAVPASLAAMTSSSVHKLVSKLQNGGSRSASSGSSSGVTASIPKKIIELRFPGGALQGGERDANALIAHLERAGLTA